MTVINAAHNKNTVAIVGDLQLSGPNSKSFNGDKIYVDNFPGTLSGITGSGHFLDEVILNVDLPKGSTPREVSEQIYCSLRNLKNEKIDAQLFSEYSITRDDLVRGRKENDKIDENLVQILQKALTDDGKYGKFQHLINNQVITIGFDGKTPEIYHATPVSYDKISQHFHSAGSGQPSSYRSLSDFYETVKDANEVSTTKMVTELVRGKIRSEKNMFVGGTPDIVYMKRGSDPIKIGEDESKLFEEIVALNDKKLMGIRSTNRALTDLINGANCDEVEPRAIDLKNEKIVRFLRGYNV